MNKIIPILLFGILFSCQQKSENGSNNEGVNKDLENKISQLEFENAQKDSVINESLAFFNEIQANLEAIGMRKDKIRNLSEGSELEPDDKKWILEEIRRINYLREDNSRLVKRLNEQLDKNGVRIKELEVMVESLLQDIKWKDMQIATLQEELDRLDSQYSALFDAYQEQSIKVDQLQNKLNKVYYAYGSSEELETNKIISKKNGFIGIGRRLELRSDFNTEYFTEGNLAKMKSLDVRGENARFLTDHPPSSYTIVPTPTGARIKISDPSEFWKISKYLVVLVD